MSPNENQLQAFDVDERTGFMPPAPPLTRLPQTWELWEMTLDAAIHAKLQLGGKVGLPVEEAEASEAWRVRVRRVRGFADLPFKV
jgi:indoleamine 2,3-dioxygenase